MPIIGKDISLLTQKASVAGTEKIPVSDTEYITPGQIRLGNAKIFYGTCSTAAGTAAKEVVCPDFVSSELVTGAIIFVTFSNTNSATASSLTLNVNGTGAKSIKKQYKTSVDDLTASGEIRANATYLFVYNGASWVCMTLDYNTTYSVIPNSEIEGGTASSGRIVSAEALKHAVEYWMAQNQSNWNETNNASPGFIQNKPTIPTVPTNVSAFTNDANYAKYYLCADEAAYNAIQNKDSGTLYLIPVS